MRIALNYRRVDPSKGGAETYVADLCNRLVGSGHEVSLYAESWKDGCFSPKVRAIEVPCSGLTRSRKIWDFALNSERILREADHDCSIGFINTWAHDVLIPQGGVREASLEANSERYPEGISRASYRAAKHLDPKRSLYREIEKRQYDLARGARYVAVSRMVKEHIRRFHEVPEDRIDVVPNAIDVERLRVDDPAATRRAFRARHGIADDEAVALFTAHNFRLKGLRPLLQALSARLERSPGARRIVLLVCGGGDRKPFERLARKLGIAEAVRFLGYLPDVRSSFHASDFFVLPTYYDPCSLVVFEALACGLPVVTTSRNGAGEVIEPGEQGFVVSAPDALNELADAFDALTNDSRRASMSAAAERLGREQSLDRHVERLLDVCARAADSRRANRSRPAA